jgi:signal transduction histidine kinase/ligand-binding sensor domain-containing protein
MRTACTRAAVSLAILLTCWSRAFALNPALDINQYAHTAWRVGQGLLSSRVITIAQTPDGYLWLGSESGLFRFDGVRTVRWQPRGDQRLPSTSIARLLVSRDGRLWIGTSAGLASWKDDRLVTYPELAGHVIGALTEDSQGTVWAGTISIPSARLCAIRGAVQCAGEDGRFGNGVFSLFADGGKLWVGAATGLWRWAPEDPVQYPTPPTTISDLIRINDGRLLIAMTGGLKQLTRETLDTYPIKDFDRPFDAQKLLLDRDGGLWIATSRRGLVHLRQGRIDVFTPSDGLSGDSISTIYEDREGNIWVGTNEGLDRFRELAITRISRKQGLATDAGFSILPARDGSVWVGGTGLTRFRDGRTTIYRMPDGLPDDHVGTLFQDSRGRILVSTLRGVAAFENDRFVPFMQSVPSRVVSNIVEERPGDLWINDVNQGLIHLIGDEIENRIPWSALGHDDHATAMVADRARQGLWLGFYKGGVAFLKDGALGTSYGTAEGLGAGRVSELRLDPEGALWAATDGGLSHIKDGHIATLTAAHGLPCEAVHWTIGDKDRSLWMLMPCGLARVTSAELAAWIADPTRSVQTTVFDSSDGARTQSTAVGLSPTAVSFPDGRLLFATASGIGVVDPRHLPFNTLPPPVQIEQIVADRETYDMKLTVGGRVRLPPRVRDLQIDYTALSLVAPEKVRFRYKLEGFDRDWHDVGSRRQAFYTDLPPRQYRFRVAAANNSGVWNEIGATVDLLIVPAYYQTRWFLALSVGVVLAAVWVAHRVRLRMVQKHEREISSLNERLMKAQEQERIRIAGELHDGAMQEMLAVTMMLGSAKRRVADDSDAKATIEKAQQKLIQVGTDIRQLSHDLHPPVLQDAGLPGAVRVYCEQFSNSSGIPVSCEADDGVRDLSRGAALALFRLVQEALGNAAKHAAAKRIAVRLTQSDGVVSLTVSDDGVGFDPGRLATSGGLGLIMMRERAGQLNGKFAFESAPGRGTTIRVVIPFR